MMVLNTKLESTRGCWFLGNWVYGALVLLKQAGNSHRCCYLLNIWVKMGGGATVSLENCGLIGRLLQWDLHIAERGSQKHLHSPCHVALQ